MREIKRNRIEKYLEDKLTKLLRNQVIVRIISVHIPLNEAQGIELRVQIGNEYWFTQYFKDAEFDAKWRQKTAECLNTYIQQYILKP